MPDLDEHFGSFRRIHSPDLWPQIAEREPGRTVSDPPWRRPAAAIVALAVGFAGLALAVRAFTGSPRPAAGVATGLIAYVRDGELWTMAADGGDARALTTNLPGEALDPEWSPDGTRLVFVLSSDRRGQEGNAFDLYLVDADGSGLTRLTTDGLSTEPSWSPDGGRIVYARLSTDDTDESIWLMNADGSNARPFTTCGPPECLGDSAPSWSPDGRRIAFARISGAGAVIPASVMIWPVDGFGFGEEPSIPLPGASEVTDLAWSPDGSRIALGSDLEGPGVYLMDADGDPIRKLTHEADLPRDLAWAPDADSIVTTSSLPGTDDSALFLLDPASGSRTRLGDAGSVCCPSWQPAVASIPVPTGVAAPASVEIRSTTVKGVAAFPSAVAAGEGGVWVTSCCQDGSASDEVVRLDPETGVVVERIPVRDAPGWDFGGAGLALGDGSVWTVGAVRNDAGCCDGLITRIDPATNSIVDEIPVPGMSEGDLWVERSTAYVLGFTAKQGGSSTPLQLASVDTTTHQIAWQVPVPGQWSQTVFVSGGWAWVLGTAPDAHGPIEVTTLYRIDPSTGDLVDQVPLPRSTEPFLPVVYPDAVWFRTSDGVQRFDPVSGAFLADEGLPGPGCCGGPFVPDGEGGVWVVSSAGAEGARSIWRVDASGNVVAAGALEDARTFEQIQGQSYAFDPSTQTIWSQHYKDSVARVQLVTAPGRPTPTGEALDTMAG